MGSESDTEALVPPAVDTLPINVALLDGDGTIRWTNRAWQEFGAHNDIAIRPDTIGVNYLEVTEAADDQHAREAAAGLKTVLSGGTDEFEIEYPCHAPNQKRWFLMRTAAFTADDERFAAVAHIDITERVEREQETELFARAVETAGQVVFVTDRDGEITYVNPAFEEVTGYTWDDALGRTPRLLKSGEHDPAFYENLWETVLAGERWEDTIINRRKSGGLYYAHQTIAPITTDDGEVSQFVSLQTEITDIEEMKQQLQAHDDVLRHELRTQLSVIQGHAEQIEDGPDAGHSDAIVAATEELLATAEKTRDLRKFLERTTDPEPMDVVQIVTNAVATQRERYPDAEVVSETPPEVVALGVSELGRALVELIENGIVHCEESPPRVEITVRDGTDWVDIGVADTGPGIPPIEYDTFEDEVPTQLNHRSGVGLDIAYWIARRAGGHLSVEDREPRGSLVTIQLPKQPGAGA